MNERGKQNPGPYETPPETYAGSPQPKGPVFPGKPYLQPDAPAPYGYETEDNLAVQRSLMDIFDEFTEVIAGELKSMNMEEYRNARFPKTEPPANQTDSPEEEGPGRPSLR